MLKDLRANAAGPGPGAGTGGSGAAAGRMGGLGFAASVANFGAQVKGGLEAVIFRKKKEQQKARMKKAVSQLNLETAVALKMRAGRARRRAHRRQRARVIRPHSKYKVSWDIWIGLLIVYSVLTVPVKLSFDIEVPWFGEGTIQDDFWLAMELFVDVLFLIDIWVNFRTAYMEEGVLIVDRKNIAKRYISSWFLPDFFSAFPFDKVAYITMGGDMYSDSSLRAFKLVKAVRIARLLKMLKMLRVFRLSRTVEAVTLGGVKLNRSVLSLAGRILKILFAAHLLACGWHAVNGCHAEEEEEEDKEDAWQLCGAPGSPGSRYLAAVYWTIATMMAVGYGEIAAYVSAERVYAVMVQLAGALCFGLIISSVSEMVDSIDPYQTQRNQRLSDIKEYMLERRLPAGLQQRIRAHFHYFYGRTTVFQEGALLENLPPSLYQGLMMDKHADQVKDLRFFAWCLAAGQRDFVVAALPLLKPMLAQAGEDVAVQGDIAEEVYFVAKGQVNSLRFEESARGGVLVGVARAGHQLGLANVTCYRALHCTLRAAARCDLLWLDLEDLEMMMDLFPGLADLITAQVTEELQAIDTVIQSATVVTNGLVSKELLRSDAAVVPCGEVDVEPVKGALAADARRHRTVRTLRLVCRGGGAAARALAAEGRGGSAARGLSRLHGDFYAEREETPAALWARERLVDPQAARKLQWDALVAALTLYSVVATPFRIGFGAGGAALAATDWAADAVFALDIALTFRTLDEAGPDLYFASPRVIARRYLRSWFVVDLASTLPLSSTLEALGTLSDRSVFGSIELVRLTRLAKFLKLIRLMRLARRRRSQISGDAPLGGSDSDAHFFLGKFLRLGAALLYLGHLFGCFLSYIELEFGHARDWTDPLADVGETWERYVASVYWAFTTMTTVGYGDIVPTSDAERVYACCIMVVGATVFGFIVGNVSKLAQQMNAAKSIAPRKMRLLHDYLAEQSVGFTLGKAIEKHMHYVFSVESAFNETGILKRLPRQLRRDTILYSHRDIIRHIPIFHKHSKAFIANVIRRMTPQFCQAGTFVYTPSEGSDGIYFVIKGIAEEVSPATLGNGPAQAAEEAGESGQPPPTPQSASGLRTEDCVVMYIVEKGGFFGHRKFLNLLGRDLGARAFTDCSLFVLTCNEMAVLNEKHESVANRLQQSLLAAIQAQTRKEKHMKARVELLNRQRHRKLGDVLGSVQRAQGGGAARGGVHGAAGALGPGPPPRQGRRGRATGRRHPGRREGVPNAWWKGGQEEE